MIAVIIAEFQPHLILSLNGVGGVLLIFVWGVKCWEIWIAEIKPARCGCIFVLDSKLCLLMQM